MRSIFVTITALLWTGLCSFLCLWTIYVDTKKQNAFLKMWSGFLVKLFDINAVVKGEDNIPEGGCIFVFNHSSYLDIPVLTYFIKKAFRFGAKVELFKIPVFGYSMKKIGMLPIFRKNKKKVLNLYKQSISKIQNNKSYMLAPEGTRTFDGKLMEFKSGPFILAIDAQAPIVPVIIHRLRRILPRRKIFANLKDTNIEIEILKPYQTKGLNIEMRKIVKNNIRNEFLKKLSD